MDYRQDHTDDDYMSWVKRQKPAARARMVFLAYTLLCSLPSIVICGGLLWTEHFNRYHILGIISFIAATTLLIVFDSLRNAAKSCYEEACAKGLVKFDYEKHHPIVSTKYLYWRLAKLAYAL